MNAQEDERREEGQKREEGKGGGSKCTGGKDGEWEQKEVIMGRAEEQKRVEQG